MPASPRHLVIGASGQVGGALWKALSADSRVTVTGTYGSRETPGLYPLDMTDATRIEEAFNAWRPDVVWLPAAQADVDACQRDPDGSARMNVTGPYTVMQAAAERRATLVFYSTDYVFDGEAGPYDETAPTHPLQHYGSQKAEAERLLLQYEKTVVIRPAWIYSREPGPRNFIWRLVHAARTHQPIRAAVDQISTPTPADALAIMSIRAVDDGFRGILHLVGPERLSRYQLTENILRLAGLTNVTIEPVTLASLDLPAPRPLNGGLVTQYSTYRITERLHELPWDQFR
ncbi:MAG: SDR family oxidoreductase [Sulfobacillus sp.]|nr:SDR family oxidoreductase [Sulfobacillus sp.]